MAKNRHLRAHTIKFEDQDQVGPEPAGQKGSNAAAQQESSGSSGAPSAGKALYDYGSYEEGAPREFAAAVAPYTPDAAADSRGEVPPMGPEDGLGGVYGADYGLGDGSYGDDDDEALPVFAGEMTEFPPPEVFNAYPPEVQRKIMEWAERDVKARLDDESRRQDEIMRAKVERERRSQTIPAIVIVLALLCGAVTGVITGNPLFPIAFLIVPLAVIGARLANGARQRSPRDKYRNPPQSYERDS